MKLLVDLGNSRVKWAHAGPRQWEVGNASIPADGFTLLLDRLWGAFPVPEHVIVSSVQGPHRQRVLHDWVQRQWARVPRFVHSQASQLGVTNRYREPATLGADRWAALIAARRLSNDAQCVVDCGTAVTVDALSANGEFLGGVILPGVRMARAALLADTQGIRDAEGAAGDCLARTTGDGVAAGSVYGLAGAIGRVVAEQRRILGSAARVVMTGGDAPLLLPLIDGSATHEPDLVLKGLALIAEAPA